MTSTRWAILGPGRISHDFAQSLTRSTHGRLQAVGSSDPQRAGRFAVEYGATAASGYDEILSRDDVDAVYIGTVHTTHASLAIAALQAGKAVLCEKPVSPTAHETTQVLEAAAAAGVPFMEAYKYRFGPLAHEFQRIISNGEIGEPRFLRASMGFQAQVRSGRLFDPAVAGGAILDAGCYPVSLAVAVASAGLVARGADRPGGAGFGTVTVDASGDIGQTGVDESARATIVIGGFEAQVETSIVQDLGRRVVLHGSDGTFESDELWGSRANSGRGALVRVQGREPRLISVPSVDPMAAEADAISRALADGLGEVAEVPWWQSLAVARILDQWRAGVDIPLSGTRESP